MSMSRVISIHALLAESDFAKKHIGQTAIEFLSTLSLRRATYAVAAVSDEIEISIHALLAESDLDLYCHVAGQGLFLSTLSLRRATAGDALADLRKWISIHALLAESDSSTGSSANLSSDFYPRSPCGERQLLPWICGRSKKDFYPRSPCGERHQEPDCYNRHGEISIHALLAESDDAHAVRCLDALPISIHALLAESDSLYMDSVPPASHFYPRSPCGERRR